MRLFAAIAISCRETKSAKTPLRGARPARSRPLQGLLFTTEIREDTEIVQQGRHAACPSPSGRGRGPLRSSGRVRGKPSPDVPLTLPSLRDGSLPLPQAGEGQELVRPML